MELLTEGEAGISPTGTGTGKPSWSERSKLLAPVILLSYPHTTCHYLVMSVILAVCAVNHVHLLCVVLLCVLKYITKQWIRSC